MAGVCKSPGGTESQPLTLLHISDFHLPAPAQAKAQQRAAAKERKKVNQAKSVVVQKVRGGPVAVGGAADAGRRPRSPSWPCAARAPLLHPVLAGVGEWRTSGAHPGRGHCRRLPRTGAAALPGDPAVCDRSRLAGNVAPGRRRARAAPSRAAPQITNSATVKKMMKSKKQRKLLKTADTN
jgi:hypothetical protein